MEYKQTWNLDQVLHGSGSSYEKIEVKLDALLDRIKKLPLTLPEIFSPFQKLLEEIHEAGSLIACLTSTDISDTRATKAEAQYHSISATFEGASQKIDALLLALTDKEFDELLKKEGAIAFSLMESRRLAKEKMSLEKELLVTELSTSGHSAYTTLYYSFMGNLTFPLGDKVLNLSKLEKLFSHADRSIQL